MFTPACSLPAESPANLAAYSATAPAHFCCVALTPPVQTEAIFSVNLFLVARASTLPPSKSAIQKTAVSTCSSTAKPFLVRRLPAWEKFLPPSRCAVASRAGPSAVLQRTSQILASWLCSRSSAAFLPALFRPSPKLPAISARPRAARPCMQLCKMLQSKRTANGGRSFSPRSVPAFSSAVAGSHPTIKLSVLHHNLSQN